jgi:hypothetical protein
MEPTDGFAIAASNCAPIDCVDVPPDISDIMSMRCEMVP